MNTLEELFETHAIQITDLEDPSYGREYRTIEQVNAMGDCINLRLLQAATFWFNQGCASMGTRVAQAVDRMVTCHCHPNGTWSVSRTDLAICAPAKNFSDINSVAQHLITQF